MDHGAITRVVLRNYKSIHECDVSLGAVTFLVGPNGAGKSNFVDAIRFVSYALSNSLEQALDSRSGLSTILHRSTTVATEVTITLFFRLADHRSGHYSVTLAGGAEAASVAEEQCCLTSTTGTDWYHVHSGQVSSNLKVVPAASNDKLYLVNASGLAPFEAAYRALSSIAIYNPAPDDIRGFKSEKRYRHLDRSASALAEVVFKMKETQPDRFDRVLQYLRRISRTIVAVEAVSVDGNFSLRFVSQSGLAQQEFSSVNVSDGTLRALAVLTALFQQNDRYPLTLVGIEEPETGLHPAAAAVLFDSLREASAFRQLVITSHSPDLLDRDDIPEQDLRAVALEDGQTVIGPVNAVGRAALQRHLYTPGELMRMDQLQPEGVSTAADGF